MFEKRLRIFLAVLGVIGLILLFRLFQLQVVQAEWYRSEASRALLLQPRSLPFVRGAIVDRAGEVLARDEACWEIRLDYRILVSDGKYLGELVKRYLREQRYPQCHSVEEVKQALGGDFERMWSELASFAGYPRAELEARRRAIVDRVERIRQAVSARLGYEDRVREQNQAHAILEGLGNQRQIEARTRFADYPWLTVVDGSRRVYANQASVAHLMGRLGKVDQEQMENDPFAEDDLRAYQADENVGISGVERAAEGALRGRRGRLRVNRKDEVIEDTSPTRGDNATLTLRLDLQQRLYHLLGERLEEPSRGGSIVVLSVPTREVLALVSYPGYDPTRFEEDYELLKNNTRDLPLRARALSSQLAPGSIVKPLTCLAGLSSGVITTDTQFTCTGSLFPDQPDRWRCWPVFGTSQRKAHGSVAVVEALAGSCNVFHYHVGEALGVDRLTQFFDMAGFGRTTGTGLIEEAPGVNPTPNWLLKNRQAPPTDGDARNYAIGQGEVSITPVQAANLMALYASGVYQPVTLVKGSGFGVQGSGKKWELPVSDAHWRAVREGIYRVTNDPDGTAYAYAHLDNSQGYALCGKTGSAESQRLHTSYRVTYTDEHGESRKTSIPAGSMSQAVSEFRARHPGVEITPENVDDEGFWPTAPSPDGRSYSHAWFVGYLQPLHSNGSPDFNRTPPVAFSVLVEFGGSGARTAGPIAKETAGILMEMLGPRLDPDYGLNKTLVRD